MAEARAAAPLDGDIVRNPGRSPIGPIYLSIAPGEIDTAILSPGTEKIVEEQIPMRRLGTPDEVADVIHFLCEKGSSYVSGAEIQINGGQHV